jgi:hypothetical protein
MGLFSHFLFERSAWSAPQALSVSPVHIVHDHVREAEAAAATGLAAE